MSKTIKTYGLRQTRIAIAANYFVAGLIFASWASRIPDIARSLRLDDGTLGAALFAIPVGQMAMMAVSGYLTDRCGSGRILAAGITAYAAVLNLIPAASGFWGLFGVLVLFGAAANLVNIALNTQACDVETLYGRSIMASFHGIWSLGGLTGGVVGMAFVHYTDNITAHFLAVGILGIATVAVSAGRFATDRKNEDTVKQQRSLLSKIDKTLMFLGVMGFAGMFCEGTLFDWSGVYFATVVRPSDGLIRVGYVAGMGMMTLGRFIADGLTTRYGTVAVLKTSGCCIAVGLLTLSVFPSLIPATVGFMLVGMGISSIVPICYSMAGHHGKVTASTAITIVSSVSFLGFMIGPPLIGFVAQALNLRIALGSASAFGLLVAIIARHQRKYDNIHHEKINLIASRYHGSTRN